MRQSRGGVSYRPAAPRMNESMSASASYITRWVRDLVNSVCLAVFGIISKRRITTAANLENANCNNAVQTEPSKEQLQTEREMCISNKRWSNEQEIKYKTANRQTQAKTPGTVYQRRCPPRYLYHPLTVAICVVPSPAPSNTYSMLASSNLAKPVSVT